MGNACPGKCAAGNQRPLDPLELSTLSNTVGANIALLRGTAVLCESCGCAYVNSRSGTVPLGKIPAAGQRQ